MPKREQKLKKTNLYELVHVLRESVLVLSAAGTWSLGFDAAREHATHNQSILPLIIAKRFGLVDTSPADTMLPMLADYLGMRWLLLIYPLYKWITGSKFTCDWPRKQGRTEQVAIIYKGNDVSTLCSRG